MAVRLLPLSLATVLLVSPLATLRAQRVDTTAAATLARWPVAPGAYVRVAASGGHQEGEIAEVPTGAARPGLRLWQRGRDTRVPLRAVDTLWVRAPATRTGAVTGAVAGGLLLGGLALRFVNACTPRPSEDPCERPGVRAGAAVGGATLGAIGGALAGALAGAVVGRLVPRWHRQNP